MIEIIDSLADAYTPFPLFLINYLRAVFQSRVRAQPERIQYVPKKVPATFPDNLSNEFALYVSILFGLVVKIR
jgi:hypothetical protein